MINACDRVFAEINRSLLNDEKPSAFLNALLQHGALDPYPFNMLSRLKEVGQSKEHHPEGNVWNHTMLVVDEAALLKTESGNKNAFMWAALLHDIGKALATKHRNGKITAYDHDKVGAELAKEFLDCFTDDSCFINQVAALVRWHMQILFVIKNLRFADVESMQKEANVHEIALLGLCDRLGRKGADKAMEQENVLDFLEIITGKKPR